MPSPSLQDNGKTVTLDLHGTAVDLARDLVLRVVREAARRGRASVKIIHGSSTSSTLHQNRTIKHEIYSLLDAGSLAPYVSSALRQDDVLLLSLSITARATAQRMFLRDVLP